MLASISSADITLQLLDALTNEPCLLYHQEHFHALNDLPDVYERKQATHHIKEAHHPNIYHTEDNRPQGLRHMKRVANRRH